MAETLLTNLLLIYLVASFAARDMPALALRIGRRRRARGKGPRRRRKASGRKLSTGEARRLAARKEKEEYGLATSKRDLADTGNIRSR